MIPHFWKNKVSILQTGKMSNADMSKHLNTGYSVSLNEQVITLQLIKGTEGRNFVYLYTAGGVSMQLHFSQALTAGPHNTDFAFTPPLGNVLV